MIETEHDVTALMRGEGRRLRLVAVEQRALEAGPSSDNSRRNGITVPLIVTLASASGERFGTGGWRHREQRDRCGSGKLLRQNSHGVLSSPGYPLVTVLA